MCWHLYLSQKPFFFFSAISLFNPDFLHSYSIIYCFMLMRFNFLESLVTDQFFFFLFWQSGNNVSFLLFVYICKSCPIFFFLFFFKPYYFCIVTYIDYYWLMPMSTSFYIDLHNYTYIYCISLFYWLFTLLAYCCCFHLYLYIHKLHVFTRTLLDYYFL